MGCTSSSPAAKRKSQEKRSAKPNVEKETAASPDMKDGGKASTPTTAGPVKGGTRLRGRVLESDTQEVTEVFRMGKVLGKGQFGTTRMCEERATGELYACKSISKRKLLSKEDIEDVQRELQILHHLGGHPNITQLKSAYEDRHNVHLVMELCSGGELFDRIVARGRYSEQDAAFMCRTIVKLIGHCHSLGVMHRDLKPENFLLASSAEDSALKGCDFGLSVFFQPSQKFSDIVGSAYYVAPEVLRRRYGKEADIWSAGVILYILLCGVPPFWGDTEQDIFHSILKGKLDFDSDPWPRISPDAKNCVRLMLQQNPAKRATADQILQHPWMKEHGTASSEPLDNIILKRMQAMDSHGSGSITVEEMERALREQGSVLSQEELQALVAGLDADRNGTIDYAEFVAGTLSLATLNKREHLLSAFEKFDTDNSGYLTIDELEAALRGDGGDVSHEVRQIMSECDKDGNGRIDFEEFASMMTAGNEPFMQSKSTMRRAEMADIALSHHQ